MRRTIFLLIGLTLFNVLVTIINVSSPVSAQRSFSELLGSSEFKSAVERIVEDCTVDGENISC
jgi:hypothetical protein